MVDSFVSEEREMGMTDCRSRQKHRRRQNTYGTSIKDQLRISICEKEWVPSQPRRCLRRSYCRESEVLKAEAAFGLKES